MRVLYSFPHPLGAPGIGTTALEQVRGLVRRGVEVTLWCTSVVDGVSGLPGEVHETLAVAGRRVPHRVLGVDRAYRYHDHRVARVVRRSPDRWDVVHGWPLGAAATFAAARAAGVACVRESPNTYTAVAYQLAAEEARRVGIPVSASSSHRPDPTRLAREELEYDRASAVLAPSSAVAASYDRRDGGAPRLLRHRYGVDLDRFPPSPGRDPGTPFTMAFVGRCEPRKGLHHALAAWQRSGASSDGRFLIVGGWESEYRARLVAELAAPGVELVGFTDDVGAVLRSCDALVLPSVEEGSALVTYEAQASGCALLVSDAAGALMDDGVHGFVHRAGDVETLSAQIDRLAADRDRLGAVRTAVLDHRERLGWDAAAEELEACYSSVIEGATDVD